MANLVDYVKLRGDLLSYEYPFNEVDYAVFASLTYVEYKDVVGKDPINIKEVYEKIKVTQEANLNGKNYLVLEACSIMPRYADIKLVNYISDISEDAFQQFSAITFILPDESLVIAFRGTDHTIVGWHENFLMLYQNGIPSEKKVLDYIEHRYKLTPKLDLNNPYFGNSRMERMNHFRSRMKSTPIVLCGHSKGGHLALYGGINYDLEVYNFDGPGIIDHDDIMTKYYAMYSKVHSFTPEYSLFGRMFTHLEKINVIKSNNKGSEQHSITSWEPLTNTFEKGKLDSKATKSVKSMFDFLSKLSDEEKEEFIEALFDLLEKLGVQSIEDMKDINYRKILSSIETFTKWNSRTRSNIFAMVQIMAREFN